MIVRILGEGQYEVPEAALDELNVLDDEVQAAFKADNAPAFTTALHKLLATVRARGTAVADDVLVPSSFVLPSADSGIPEVAAMLSDEGLIPG